MRYRPKIKICGLRRVEDARLAVELGATHLGCIVEPESPRCATFDQVRAIGEVAGDLATVVLVFHGCSTSDVFDACLETGVHQVQVQGVDEAFNHLLESQGLAVYRVYTIDAQTQCLPVLTPAPDAGRLAVLWSGPHAGGRPFDWRLLGNQGPEYAFVAGGISPTNIQDLVRRRPFGIDLSTGVESAPGEKDRGRLLQLFESLELQL